MASNYLGYSISNIVFVNYGVVCARAAANAGNENIRKIAKMGTAIHLYNRYNICQSAAQGFKKLGIVCVSAIEKRKDLPQRGQLRG